MKAWNKESRTKAAETKKNNNNLKKLDQLNKGCKICIHCKQDLPLDNFKPHRSNFDNLDSRCHDCVRKRRKVRELERLESTSPVNIKKCFKCKLELDSSNFLINKSSKTGLNGWCKKCTKDIKLKKKYSISIEKYKEMLETQQYKCKICLTIDPRGPQNVFVVDHCHKTGLVRGLLCNHCNTALGKFKDSSEILDRALAYVKLCGMID